MLEKDSIDVWYDGVVSHLDLLHFSLFFSDWFQTGYIYYSTLPLKVMIHDDVIAYKVKILDYFLIYWSKIREKTISVAIRVTISLYFNIFSPLSFFVCRIQKKRWFKIIQTC